MAFNARLMIAKVVDAGRLGLAQGRGRSDPLGGRQRRAGDQSQPRRRARSARSVARHLLAARAGGRRVRVFEGRGRGRGGRQRAAVAGNAVGVRALSGLAAARDRGQRGAPGRVGARLLEPRRRLQRSRGARRRDLLDHPDAAWSTRSRGASTCRTPNCGPFEFQRRDRHVLRGSAGLRGGGAAPRRRIRRCAPSRSRGCSSGAPTTPTRPPAARMCPAGRDRFTGWGTLDVESALTRLTTGPLPPPDHYEPNDDAGPWAHALPPLPRTIEATLDYWDDDLDVYRIHLHEGAAAVRTRSRPTGRRRRSAQRLGARDAARRRSRRAGGCSSRSRGSPGSQARRRRTGRPQTGIYYLEAKLAHPTRDPLVYRLAVARADRLGALAAVRAAARPGRPSAGRAPASRRRPCAAGRPSSRRRRRRRTPPRRSRRQDRGSRRRRCARRAGSSGPRISSLRRSVRPMKLSFVVTTHGAMKTSSSSVEYAVMYASAWIRVPAPTVVSFSISEPRPRMQSSAIVTRSRMHDWSPTMQLAPTVEPAKTIAPVETIVPSPIVVGGSGSRFAVECGAERRLLADDGVLEHAHAFAEHGAGIDDRRRVDLSHSREFVSISSARTTRAPSRATLPRSCCPSISSRK